MKKNVFTTLFAIAFAGVVFGQTQNLDFTIRKGIISVVVIDESNAEPWVSRSFTAALNAAFISDGYTPIIRSQSTWEELNRLRDDLSSGRMRAEDAVGVGELWGEEWVCVITISNVGNTGNRQIIAEQIGIRTGHIVRVVEVFNPLGTPEQVQRAGREIVRLLIPQGNVDEQQIGLLSVERSNVYMCGVRLDRTQVRNILSTNTQAFELYNHGIRQIDRARRLTVSGLYTFGAGTVCLVAGFLIHDWDATDARGRREEPNLGTILLWAFGGTAAFVGGMTLLGSAANRADGRRNIENAINRYNRELQNVRAKTPNIELHFGATQNGLGFVVNF